MKLFLRGHSFRYEAENIVRMFYFDVEVQECAATKEERDTVLYYALLYRSGKNDRTLMAAVRDGEIMVGNSTRLLEGTAEEDAERQMAVMLFDLLVTVTGKRPEWGIITGVRPAKFVKKLIYGGMTDIEVEEKLRYDYRVTRNKARLAIETSHVSEAAEKKNNRDSYSLYISIPFCPSRCEYCSFVSKTIEKEHKLVEPYLDGLIRELAVISELARLHDLRLETIYVGGGTPTVLTVEQLRLLLAAVLENFPIHSVLEYTVEAGRPDTITLDKLVLLRDYGVTRVSINPQSFNDEVLHLIGRRHTANDVKEAFALARIAGFKDINADLIAGLRGDNIAGFKNSIEALLALEPEEVTVHALTLKRASRMREKDPYFSPDAAAMVDFAYGELTERGYRPYYMYKQKGTVDSLENVGYGKPGFEGMYNIFIMDEMHSILSAGAGGVTKLRNPGNDRIERIFNYKYPLEYINGFDEIINRKEGINRFYENFI